MNIYEGKQESLCENEFYYTDSLTLMSLCPTDVSNTFVTENRNKNHFFRIFHLKNSFHQNLY